MRERRPGHRVLLGALVLLLLSAGPARAYHDDKQHMIDYTAQTLQALEVKLGFADIGFGATDWLTLETDVLPWILVFANLSAKFKLWSNENWAFSARLAYWYLDMKRAWWSGKVPVTFHIIPIEVAASRRLGTRWWLSAGVVYTPYITKGSFSSDDLKGAAGYSNSQLTLAVEFRINERWAIYLRTRHLLHIEVSGRVDSEIQVDDYTTVETHASVASKDILGLGFPQTFQIVPGAAYSGKYFTIEFGLGYGNLNIPGPNFILPRYLPVPQLDLYWRF